MTSPANAQGTRVSTKSYRSRRRSVAGDALALRSPARQFASTVTTQLDEHSTPWCVICRFHGHVALTEREYGAQLGRSDEEWRCPICTADAVFDEAQLDASETGTLREAPIEERRYIFPEGEVLLRRDPNETEIWTAGVVDVGAFGAGATAEQALAAAIIKLTITANLLPEPTDAIPPA